MLDLVRGAGDLLVAEARGAVVSYTLSYNDDGTGTQTPGMFAIYADVSPDNGGLFAFGVDLADGPIDWIMNLAPQGNFRKTASPTKFVGFSAGVAEDAAGGKVSGLPDLAKGSSLIPAYGFGQISGDLNNLRPANYGNYFDSNPNAPGSVYRAHLLLAVGGYHGSASGLHFQAGSVDNKASVYDDCSGTESVVAQLSIFNVIEGAAAISAMAGESSQAITPCAAVPEPGVILLTLSGLIGLNLRTSRAKRG